MTKIELLEEVFRASVENEQAFRPGQSASDRIRLVYWSRLAMDAKALLLIEQERTDHPELYADLALAS